VKVSNKLENPMSKVIIRLIVTNGNTSKSRDIILLKKIAEKVNGISKFLLYQTIFIQPKYSAIKEQISPTGSLKATFRAIKYIDEKEGKIIKAYLIIADIEHKEEMENAIKEFGFENFLKLDNGTVILKNSNHKLIILVFLGEKLCLEEQILLYLRNTNEIKDLDKLNEIKNCNEIKGIIKKNNEVRRYFSNFEDTLEYLIKKLNKNFFPQIWEAMEFIEKYC
jgi:hypothetical protein